MHECFFTSAIPNLNLFRSWQIETMSLFFHTDFWLLLPCWGPGGLWAVQGIAAHSPAMANCSTVSSWLMLFFPGATFKVLPCLNGSVQAGICYSFSVAAWQIMRMKLSDTYQRVHSRVQLSGVTNPCHCSPQSVFSRLQTRYNYNVVHLTINSFCPGSTYHQLLFHTLSFHNSSIWQQHPELSLCCVHSDVVRGYHSKYASLYNL